MSHPKPLFLTAGEQQKLHVAKFIPALPLYVYRKVENAAEIIAHFKDQGLEKAIPPEEGHVTITFSKSPVDWLKMGAPWNFDNPGGKLIIPAGGARQAVRFGHQREVLALAFANMDLEIRHDSMVERGASWDFPNYHPHMTISYDAPRDFDETKIKPWSGEIVLGPEIFEPLDREAVDRIVEKSAISANVMKVDSRLGLVFGWAIVCKEDGKDYFDLNVDRSGPMKGQRVPEHIPEDEMVKAALDFSESTDRPGNEMHAGPMKGQHVFLFPMTTDIAKALGIQTSKTGLLVAYKPPPDVFAKFESGEYTGFSIEGWHTDSEVING